ncbi:hypothetical protein BY996DRAFT_6488040 [Phakopsora pachyrhizi]|nr:hypothetical protein BY996DRAFT_6488040 [Phakopsora pachyrhizi]
MSPSELRVAGSEDRRSLEFGIGLVRAAAQQTKGLSTNQGGDPEKGEKTAKRERTRD